MPSETIWSSTSLPHQPLLNYRTVLDQVDPEVAKLLASNSLNELLGRRFSFTDNSELDGGIFSFRKGSLSAVKSPYAASTGGVHGPVPAGGSKHMNFGTASISGGIASRHPPQDSFLQKFSSVAEATRDIELANNFSKISLDGSTRRTSFNQLEALPLAILSLPHGLLNENLNMPAPRTSRHQSISEKIDHYNSTSPIQASATLSISSDLNSNSTNNPSMSNVAAGASENSHSGHHNFWNPATATSFTPGNSYNYFMENPALGGMQVPPNFNPYGRNPANVAAISPPPFMIPSPPPQFMDPGMYNMMGYGNLNALMQQDKGSEEQRDPENSLEDPARANNGPPRNSHTPGIGFNRQMPPPTAGFMFHPYGAYQQSPSPASAQNQTSSGVTSPEQPKSTPSSQPIPPPTAPPSAPSLVPQVFGKRKGGPRNASTGPGNASAKGGANHIYRSPLLEEVRSNFKGKEYFLKDIYGHAVEFTKDQHGSRFIQQKLPEASDEEKEVIFNEIRNISYELMTDVFGNYVIQKYFEFGSTTQQNILLECMIGHIYELSLQMYGCRVVQRALEAIELEGQIKIIEELKDHILVCAKDQNGNHVIQKSIERIPFNKIRFVLLSLDNQIYHLSTHPYGCRVIQRLLEYSNIDDQQNILNELNRFIFYLIQDQYGNYVMQHILERGHPGDREEILKVVLGSVVNFSKHKFASNVIEKCIKFGTFEQRKRIWHEVMLGNESYDVEVVSDDSALALMMKDQYANYVIQKLVEGFNAKSEEKKLLVAKLRQYLKQISSKNTYGKHLASVEKMIIVAETALNEAERST